uniref:Uncharacterized protein n=1 Tax=Physcomitrium patens TaxID=3218 RepID=A0A2K1J738_PHYPA|nr:hypothetical protein PHYPA_020449 [Physcomitrium patens]
MHYKRIIELVAVDAIHFFYTYKHFLDYPNGWNIIYACTSQFTLLKNSVNFEHRCQILQNVEKFFAPLSKAKKLNVELSSVINVIINFFGHAMA